VGTIEAAGELVVAAWVDYRDANEEEYLRRSLDAGASWGPLRRLTHNPADSWAPSLAIAGTTVHLAWFDRRNAGATDHDVERALDAAARLVGLKTAPPPDRDAAVYYLPPLLRRLEQTRREIAAAAPAWVGRGGDPRRLERLLREWKRRMEAWSSGWEIYYKRSTDGGAHWGPDVRLTTAPGPSLRPSIVASGREVSVAWFDGRDGAGTEIYFKTSSDGGRHWGGDRRLTHARGQSAHVSIAQAGEALYLVWFDERSGVAQIYTKRRAHDRKGYGFITRDGAEEIFVHRSGIAGVGPKTLPEGVRVEFEVAPGQKGPQARNVRIVRE
jgi:CspA family cold shock protein